MKWTLATDLQDAARKVVIIVNAAVALTALGHVVSIKAGVGHGGWLRVPAIAAGRAAESAFGILLLRAVEEECSSGQSGQTNDTHHHASSDSCGVVAALDLGCLVGCLLRVRSSDHDRLATRVG